MPVEVKAEAVEAKETPFQLDEKGYFLIRLKDGYIELGHCTETNVVTTLIKGKKPKAIYETAITKGLIQKQEHAAYLGKELQKAYIALTKNLIYVQDEELDFA